MDEYGQIGPESGAYDGDLLAIAGFVAGGRSVRFTLAERMTAFDLVICRVGDLTTFGKERLEDPRTLLVTHVGRGSMLVPPGYEHDAAYINETMHYQAGGNGEIIATFLARFGRAFALTEAS